MEADAGDALPYAAMVMGLGGGLALFLYGMRVMTRALSLAAGGGMKRLLAHATRNRFAAAGAGAVTTAVVQSSSVVTVLVVGFIGAGLLTAQRAVGVVIGANVGTTITAQIVAFKVTASALVLIAGGLGAPTTGGGGEHGELDLLRPAAVAGLAAGQREREAIDHRSAPPAATAAPATAASSAASPTAPPASTSSG